MKKKIKKFSVILVEDDFPAARKIEKYVNSHPELIFKDIARTGTEALEKLSNDYYDLILMDIHLPDMSGIDVLEQQDKIGHVIFVTAYDKYAIKAFELGAIDYLLKPFSQDRFNKAIEKFKLSVLKRHTNLASLKKLGLSFSQRGDHYLMAYQDITYLSSQAKHTIIHTIYKDFKVSNVMKKLETKLNKELFVRIHKQYVVNMNYILRLKHVGEKTYKVFLKDDKQTFLPVGRTYISDLKYRLNA